MQAGLLGLLNGTQNQASQQTPGTAPGVPQPYDPVTGLPTPMPPPAPIPGAPPPSGAPPPAVNVDPNIYGTGMAGALRATSAQITGAGNPDGSTTETRSGIGHFGGGAPLPAPTTTSTADPNTGATPTQAAPQNYLEDAYKQLGGAYLAPSYMGSSMGGLQSQLSQPGQAEQFYKQAQNTQTDPYYQRLQQQGNDALNQQMAARGSYNSGGALAALGNFNSGLAAQQYGQMGQLAQNAQNGQQARVGLSGQLAQTADAGDMSRLNSLMSVAGQAQGMNQNQINSMLSQQMGIDNNASGLVGGFYGAGGQLSGQATTDQINAMIQAGQAQAQGQQAQQGQMMGLASLFA